MYTFIIGFGHKRLEVRVGSFVSVAAPTNKVLEMSFLFSCCHPLLMFLFPTVACHAQGRAGQDRVGQGRAAVAMAQQGATLQNYNNELVKCIEDLREKREEVRDKTVCVGLVS